MTNSKKYWTPQPRFRSLENLPVFTLFRTKTQGYVLLSGPERHDVGGIKNRKVFCVRLGVNNRGTAMGGFCWFSTEFEARACLRRHAKVNR